MTEFYTWLTEHLTRRGWGVTELSRQIGLTHSAVSHVMSTRNQPSPRFCAAVANALGVSVEEVYRHAGLLPQLPQISDPHETHIQRLAEQLRAIAQQPQGDLLLELLEVQLTAWLSHGVAQ